MAWTETDPMKERLHFVADWDRRLDTVTELCARYGVSRKTGYKWLARYADVGVAGLAERSRAPHRCPHRIAPAVAAAIVEACKFSLSMCHGLAGVLAENAPS